MRKVKEYIAKQQVNKLLQGKKIKLNVGCGIIFISLYFISFNKCLSPEIIKLLPE